MNKFIKFGLIFLMIYCPLAFGAVHIFSFTLMEIGVLLLLFSLFLKMILNSQQVLAEEAIEGRERICLSIERTPLNYLGLLFLLIILLHLIPLPWQLVEIIAPSTFKVYSKTFEEIPPFISLSLYPYASKIGLFKVLTYFGIFFLVINWADSKRRIRGIIYTFIFVGTFEAIYGIFNYLTGSSDIWWFKGIRNGTMATGTYINRNHYVGLLEIIIPVSFGFLISLIGSGRRKHQKIIDPQIKSIRKFLPSLELSDPDLNKKILNIFLVAMMILGLILSGSRGGIICLIISFIFMNSLLFFQKRYKKYAIVFLIICSITLIYGLQTGMEKTIQRFDTIMEDGESRIRLAKTSLNLWREFPLLGTGWGTFMEVYRKYKSPEDVPHEVDHVHHDWIELGVETGLLGFCLGVFSFLFCLGYFFHLWKKRNNSFSVGVGLGGMGAMVSLCLHSFLDFNMHIPANAFLLSIAIGITLKALTCRRGMEKSSHYTISFPACLRFPFCVLMASGFCYAMIVVVKPYMAERNLPTLPDNTVEKRTPTFREVCTAIGYEDKNAQYFYYLASLLRNNTPEGKNEGIKDHITEGKDSIPEEIWADKIILRKEGNDLVRYALRKAIQLSPTNPNYHLELAWQILFSGELSKNVKQLESLMTASEKELNLAVYFMPNSAKINFSAGSYWLWKARAVEDEKTILESFYQFIKYFKKTYQLDNGYKEQIRQMILPYYDSPKVFNTIFKTG